MERPYAVLHKNLTELESRLHQLSVASSSFKNHNICNDLAGKVDFLKALLAAEMESHANHTLPRHLLHFDERLKALDQALHDRDDLSGLPEDGLCDVSMCSCTNECFEEEEEEEKAEEEVDNVPETEDFPTLTDENVKGLVAAEQHEGSSARCQDGETAQHHRLAGCCCRFIIIVTAAATAAAIGVAACFYGAEEESFLVPT
ncbi:hypothetical protein OPV22_025113 [Ensete ventricosum]|uniref:DUF7610 domain-containing protein n=1 Tax=Ensete ventricosum TaxID=4639 RepID=A0AAV8Q8Z7_ENSVE|nr:hypothetical protein OPV22_025113 [Ensete ventricosum]RWW31871.1 hypothetical protein GW17_00003481 [Ensete ventricosum]RWW55308.1 hypothetical protein BHE74_00038059 [Ensete ventricosum]RZR82536.1 hypothetical protein BHM03_00008985 [Ensete ventricosum]